MYRRILEFQVRFICHFDRNTAHQFARNLVLADEWKKQLEQIRLCEATCEKLRVLLDTKERQQGMERLESRLREVDAEVQQRADTLLSEFKDLREDQKGRKMSKVESECHSTLRTLNYESDKSRIADPVSETCKWFLSHERYQSWLSESRSRLLWVTADPGCGKSVLSKYLINIFLDRAAAGTSSVCYFFFRDGSEKNQEGSDALCALLHQLFEQKRILIRHALPDFRYNGSKLSGLFETLWSIFLKVASDPEAGVIICILDALDECGEKTRNPLLKLLGLFCANPPASATVKFIITSRPYTTIGDNLWEHYPQVSSVRLMGESEGEMSIIQREISRVIDKKVERFRDKRQQLGICDDAHQAIQEQIKKIKNRTYLWVSLIFPELEKNVRSGRGTLLRIIETLPTTLHEAYERILSKSTNPIKARRLLHFVLAAQNPLTLQELNKAMVITKICTSVDDLELEPDATFQETVRELCGLFISVSLNRVYLIHQTAREFLLAPGTETQLVAKDIGLWKYSINLRTSHFELAKSALLYLHLSGLESWESLFGRGVWVLGGSGPVFGFAGYSAMYWTFHIRESESEAVESLMDLMLSITTPGTQAFKKWIEFYYDTVDMIDRKEIIKMDQLHLAVCFGLRPVIRALLNRDSIPASQRPSFHTAAALTMEHCPDMFSLFLDKGLDMDAQIPIGSFMHEAVRLQSVEIVRLLVGAGFSVNVQDSHLGEPLPWAASLGHWSMVSLLVEQGARVNHRGKSGNTALHWAVEYRSLEMTTYLIENGAVYDIKNFSGQTPLLSAASGFRKPREELAYVIAELLVKCGAGVDSSDNAGKTALSYAAASGDVDMTTLLIGHGALVDSSDNTGRTALSYAAASGDLDMTTLLIGHVALVDSRDQHGRTPLSYAVESRKEPVADFLIQQGAQVDMRCIEMRTPLSYAAQCGNTPGIRLLIENGAAVNSSDWECNTPLMYALQVNMDIAILKDKLSCLLTRSFSRKIESIRNSVPVLVTQNAKPSIVNQDGCSSLLIFERWNSLYQGALGQKDKAARNDIRNMLRCPGVGEPKSPTSSDIISLVVAQLVVKLIEAVEDFTGIEREDYPIAVQSSVELFCQWKLHPTVSSITLRDNGTIGHEMNRFILAQARPYEESIADAEKSQEEHPGPHSVRSAASRLGDPPPLQDNELVLPKTELSEDSNEYGGLIPFQAFKPCFEFLQRLAMLQQRLFNVNRCLYYLDRNPNDRAETIDELIINMNRWVIPKAYDSGKRCHTVVETDDSCEGDLAES